MDEGWPSEFSVLRLAVTCTGLCDSDQESSSSFTWPMVTSSGAFGES